MNRSAIWRKMLRVRYAQVGVGRDDGDPAGEFCAIYFDRAAIRRARWRHILARGTGRAYRQCGRLVRPQADLHLGAGSATGETVEHSAFTTSIST